MWLQPRAGVLALSRNGNGEARDGVRLVLTGFLRRPGVRRWAPTHATLLAEDNFITM